MTESGLVTISYQEYQALLALADSRAAAERERDELLHLLAQREQEYASRVEELRAHYEKLLNRLAYRRSERYKSGKTGPEQVSKAAAQGAGAAPGLQTPEVDETNGDAESEFPPDDAPQSKRDLKGKHPGRRKLPEDIPAIEIVLPPDEDVTGWIKIGEERTEELEYVPGFFVRKIYVRERFREPDGERIVIAPPPIRVIDKAIPGPFLLATLLTNKYLDHLPLYRQQLRFLRRNVHLDDATVHGWMQKAIGMLGIIYDRICERVIQSNYLMADETTIKVLQSGKEKKKPPGAKHGKAHQGYYWVYLEPRSRIVMYRYEPGRGGCYVRQHLKDFSGYLQTDAYAGYRNLEAENPGIRLTGCWAHARRNFVDAIKTDNAQADWFLTQIAQLYAIEAGMAAQHSDHDVRLAIRQQQSVPVLERIRTRLDALAPSLTPKSLMGLAVNYVLNNWTLLTRFATDGKLEIDNNLVENSIRPVAIGRKNYLFAGNDESAQRGAVIYSIMETCKALNIDPETYIADVLDTLPARKIHNIEDLMPWNWKPDKQNPEHKNKT